MKINNHNNPDILLMKQVEIGNPRVKSKLPVKKEDFGRGKNML